MPLDIHRWRCTVYNYIARQNLSNDLYYYTK